MKVTDRIRYVGVNDYQIKFFENQWPLPEGISYNSYLVVDDKIALIDTAAAAFKEEFFNNIQREIGDKQIDYLIVNHMEPDHSALMSNIREKYPNIKILASAKAIPMIAGFNGITDNVTAVKDGESVSLGSCSLRFFMIPMVHWPETMATWLEEEKTIFSGDAFGCFKGVNAPLNEHLEDYHSEMIRYYSCIVGKYGVPVQNALKKLSPLGIKRICSTHGPIWNDENSKVIQIYDMLSKYETKPGVCLAYCSMYGNTEKAAFEIKKEIEKRGITCAIHNLVDEGASYALRDVFIYDTIVVGAPTYNGSIFPPAEAFMSALKLRMIKNHRFAAFGSFTWASASVKLMNEIATAMKLEILSDGVSFSQAFDTQKFDIPKFVDEITRR